MNVMVDNNSGIIFLMVGLLGGAFALIKRLRDTFYSVYVKFTHLSRWHRTLVISFVTKNMAPDILKMWRTFRFRFYIA